jgi:hypothetical protein
MHSRCRNSRLIIIDECEGCQVHNLWCEKGTGRLHGFTCPGHFAENSLADTRNAMVLPKDMDMVTAAPLVCAGITGTSRCPRKWNFTDQSIAHQAVKGCDLEPGQWLAIVSCGGLGHLSNSIQSFLLDPNTDTEQKPFSTPNQWVTKSLAWTLRKRSWTQLKQRVPTSLSTPWRT